MSATMVPERTTGAPLPPRPRRPRDAWGDPLAHRQVIGKQFARYACTSDASDAGGRAGIFADNGAYQVRLATAVDPTVGLRGAEQRRAVAGSGPQLLHHLCADCHATRKSRVSAGCSRGRYVP